MKISLETMWNLILMTILCLMIGSLIGSFLYMLQARSCLSAYVVRIECSDEREAELELCKKDAKAHGYTLTCETVAFPTKNTVIRLKLCYDLKTVNLFGKNGSLGGVMEAYAR